MYTDKCTLDKCTLNCQTKPVCTKKYVFNEKHVFTNNHVCPKNQEWIKQSKNDQMVQRPKIKERKNKKK